MQSDLKKTLQRQTYRHTLFPTLLLVVQELDTWEARANALNAVGLTTFHGKPWTKGNLHSTFKSYWSENDGRYSWNKHEEQLRQLEKLVA